MSHIGNRTPDTQREVVSKLRSEVEFMLPLLRGLDDVDRCQPSDPALTKCMVAAGLDGLTDLVADSITGGALAQRQGPVLEGYFRRVITDEATGRAHLGEAPLPPPEPPADMSKILGMVSQIHAQQQAMQAQLVAVTTTKRGPLFSVAADAYHDKLRLAHGDGYDELKYVRHRKAVFLQLCEDKPVNKYTQEDLQSFVNLVRHLPANVSQHPDYKIDDVRQYIDDAKASGAKGLSESTLINDYLGQVKTILRDGCASAGVPFTLEGGRIVIPKGVPKARHRLAPDYVALNRVFCAGVESGMLAEAMLPLLGFLTGRRLGLLTFLRREADAPRCFREGDGKVSSPRRGRGRQDGQCDGRFCLSGRDARDAERVLARRRHPIWACPHRTGASAPVAGAVAGGEGRCCGGGDRASGRGCGARGGRCGAAGCHHDHRRCRGADTRCRSFGVTGGGCGNAGAGGDCDCAGTGE